MPAPLFFLLTFLIGWAVVWVDGKLIERKRPVEFCHGDIVQMKDSKRQGTVMFVMPSGWLSITSDDPFMPELVEFDEVVKVTA